MEEPQPDPPRRVRRPKTPAPEQSAPPASPPDDLVMEVARDIEKLGERPQDRAGGFPVPRVAWGSVIKTVLDIDVEDSHRRITRAIGSIDGRIPTRGSCITALDVLPELLNLAHRLAEKARADYEDFKEQHEAWLEPRRTAVRAQLEDAKEKGAYKKSGAISDAIVMDAIRAEWPDEYLEGQRKWREYQAAVHVLESLPKTVQTKIEAVGRTLAELPQAGGEGR